MLVNQNGLLAIDGTGFRKPERASESNLFFSLIVVLRDRSFLRIKDTLDFPEQSLGFPNQPLHHTYLQPNILGNVLLGHRLH
jgi:hypothetical protein